MLSPHILTDFNSSRSLLENSNTADSLKIAKKSEIIKAELQKYRVLKSKAIPANNTLSDPNFSINSNFSPQMNSYKGENIALSELLSPRKFC